MDVRPSPKRSYSYLMVLTMRNSPQFISAFGVGEGFRFSTERCLVKYSYFDARINRILRPIVSPYVVQSKRLGLVQK